MSDIEEIIAKHQDDVDECRFDSYPYVFTATAKRIIEAAIREAVEAEKAKRLTPERVDELCGPLYTDGTLSLHTLDAAMKAIKQELGGKKS